MNNIERVERCVETLEQQGVLDTEAALVCLDRLAGMRRMTDEGHAVLLEVIDHVFSDSLPVMHAAERYLGLKPRIFTHVTRRMILQALSTGDFPSQVARCFKERLRTTFPPTPYRPDDNPIELKRLIAHLPEGACRDRFGAINWLVYKRPSDSVWVHIGEDA